MTFPNDDNMNTTTDSTTDIPNENASAVPPEPIRNALNDANSTPAGDPVSDPMRAPINRLAGEPAPDISPDEFARLQRMGEIHLDDQGRIRPQRREDNDPGVSLRKRRAWYA